MQEERITFRLPVFEGPLDLLLYLIRIQEIDIRDIPIAQVTGQYLEIINFMKELNLDVAGDYLLMAATLIHIKSRMLLPRAPVEEEEAIEDPREALVQKLLEYERFKKAAEVLYERVSLEGASFARGEPEEPESSPEDPELLVEAGLLDLVATFRKILQARNEAPTVSFRPFKFTIEGKARFILQVCGKDRNVPLQDILTTEGIREELIVAFLALLELVRLGAVKIYQSKLHSEIFIRSTGRAVDLGTLANEGKEADSP